MNAELRLARSFSALHIMKIKSAPIPHTQKKKKRRPKAKICLRSALLVNFTKNASQA
jgi:predicted transcriptional regulator